ncbi:ABC-type transport auxiliary lipoprotein family protein [Marinobacterium aestuariivivens]|uniref:ABC-type transport auxiliary lipoprotein family protein n=1 Tax=Marinobacterium aestuariivivens TaxID=1698799 RepID=A0ABW2A2H7_9GAMM
MSLKLVSGLLAILLLGACTVLPGAGPVRVYSLAPPPAPALAAPKRVDGLRVLRPQANDLLESRHMLVRPEGQPFSYYKNVRWSARVPQLWRDYLVEALRRDGRFSRVSSDEVRLQASYELVSRLNAFQTEYRDGKPVVTIGIYLQLVDSDSGRIVAERSLSREQPAAAAGLDAVIEAYDAAAGGIAAAIADWLAVAAAGRVRSAQ